MGPSNFICLLFCSGVFVVAKTHATKTKSHFAMLGPLILWCYRVALTSQNLLMKLFMLMMLFIAYLN
jgi:hypothetical protein